MSHEKCEPITTSPQSLERFPYSSRQYSPAVGVSTTEQMAGALLTGRTLLEATTPPGEIRLLVVLLSMQSVQPREPTANREKATCFPGAYKRHSWRSSTLVTRHVGLANMVCEETISFWG